MPGNDPARGARDTGRTDRGIGERGNEGSRGGGKSTGSKAPAARGVYSSPIGPMPGTGDPMGNGSHFNEKGTGFGGFLDSVFGYENIGQRVNAKRNNPAAKGSPVAIVPSYPYADLGYVAASILGTPMSQVGALAAIPGIADSIFNNKPYESMAQKIASGLGANRGPQGPDVGVGHDRAGQGSALGLLDTRARNNGGLLSTALPTSQALPAQQQADLYKKRNYALGLNGVPGPSPYQYQTARWI